MKYLLGILIGGGIGYFYYRLVGGRTGYCPITRSPWISVLYGVLIGLLLVMR